MSTSRFARSWRHVQRSRLGPLYVALALFVVISTITRLALLGLHFDQVADVWARIAPALFRGLAFDLLVGLYVCLPFAVFLMFMHRKWLASRPAQWLVALVSLFYIFGLLYLVAAEIVFFDEFNSRFNYVAVDYLAHSHEVFVNIRETYPVWTVLGAAALLTVAVYLALHRSLLAGLKMPISWRHRMVAVAAYAGALAAGTTALTINAAQVSDNRVLNEIVANGVYSFAYAAATNEVDYDHLYARMDDVTALERVRALIRTDNSQFLHPDDPYSIDRAVSARGSSRAMNVVLVLEESFGSNFVGSLHPEGLRLTPEFDRLARDGLFFTHIYATGNRTVRGIEASLTSLPPLPGRSVVKQPDGVGLFTLPSILKAKGYQTAFIYGGRSYFDNIRTFALGNGYDRVIEQDDFEKVTFTTIWGVCDEDLFDNALAEMDAMHAGGRPFFVTLLTVSNHSPFTYPAGRIQSDPGGQHRENAVQYADYAIGKFIRDARAHAFFANTLFVFLGDHGARVYGRQEIPMDSYEIPVLFYSPKLIARGRRVDVLGSQLDLAPTLLGLLDMDYNSQFFGRDLLHVAPGRTWALMSHNRDVALLRDNKLAVLGVRGTKELWRRDPVTGAFTRLADDADPELLQDAIAYYQAAYRLYKMNRLRPLAQTPLSSSRLAHAGASRDR